MSLFNKYFCCIILVSSLLFDIYSLQFGNGNDESSTEFIQVATDVKDFYLDDFNTSYIIKNDGSLWGTGELVYNDFFCQSKKINTFEKIEENVTYFDGLYLIKNDSSVYRVLQGLQKFEFDIEKGAGPFFITKNKELWVYGNNDNGSFWTGLFNVNYEYPIKVMNNVKDVCYSNLYSLVITSDDELLISGTHYLPLPFKRTNKFVKLADNVRAVTQNFFITKNDELYAFGWCAHGVTGLGDLNKTYGILPTKVMDNVKNVVSNGHATLILKNDGKVFGCGGDSPNYCGELGFGNYEPVFTPTYIMENVTKIDIATIYSAILKNDGTLWMCGENSEWGAGL